MQGVLARQGCCETRQTMAPVLQLREACRLQVRVTHRQKGEHGRRPAQDPWQLLWVAAPSGLWGMQTKRQGLGKEPRNEWQGSQLSARGGSWGQATVISLQELK